MFLKILKHELRQLTRDRMYAFFIFFEVVLIVTSYVLLPYLRQEVSELAEHIALVMLLLMTGIVFGAITGFSMLDDLDDGVLFSLKITPISMRHYTFFKLLVSFFFSVIGTLILLTITRITLQSSILHVLMITILASLQAPFIALVMASFSKNKVEGFVIMKLTGLTLIGPIMALFIVDWTELLLGIFPGFWPSRMILMEVTNLSYYLPNTYIYFLLGLIVNTSIMYGFFNIYRKKFLS